MMLRCIRPQGQAPPDPPHPFLLLCNDVLRAFCMRMLRACSFIVACLALAPWPVRRCAHAIDETLGPSRRDASGADVSRQ